jgi:hypothetical protein
MLPHRAKQHPPPLSFCHCRSRRVTNSIYLHLRSTRRDYLAFFTMISIGESEWEARQTRVCHPSDPFLMKAGKDSQLIAQQQEPVIVLNAQFGLSGSRAPSTCQHSLSFVTNALPLYCLTNPCAGCESCSLVPSVDTCSLFFQICPA